MFSSVTKKVALFAAIIGVTGVIAGASAFAVQGPSQGNGHGNSYAANQCKNGGWKDLGYKNQGQCIRDMVGNSNGNGNSGGNNGNNGNNGGNGSFGSIISSVVVNITSSVQNSINNIVVSISNVFNFR